MASLRTSDIARAVGCHPNDTSQLKEGDLRRLAELADDARVVAVVDLR